MGILYLYVKHLGARRMYLVFPRHLSIVRHTHTHWNLSNWKSYKLKAILSLLFAFMHGICAMRLYLALYRAVWVCVWALCAFRRERFCCFSALPAFANFLIPFWHGKKYASFFRVSRPFCSHVFICVARFRWHRRRKFSLTLFERVECIEPWHVRCAAQYRINSIASSIYAV